MYAVILTGGKQYKVSEGDVIRVEKLEVEEGEKLGKPYVEGAKVSGTVTKNGKGKKIVVYRYKRKTGYHKKNGHRQLFTEVKIDSIA